MDEATLEAVAGLSGLVIAPEYRAGVLRQWRVNAALAAPLLAFELPEEVQPAPVFRP